MGPCQPTPHLIPDDVREYAEALKRGTLSETTLPYGGTPDDVKTMLPYLEAVAAGDEPEALHALANILAASPLRLWHPYTQSTISHLFMLFAKFACLPKAFRDQVNAALDLFVIAWGYGLTGRDVSVRTYYAKRGQTPLLFPALDERDGPFLTPEAVDQRQEARQFAREARQFARYLDDLKTTLARRIRWKELRNDFRDSRPEGQQILVEDTATALRAAFEEFLRTSGQSAGVPPADECRRIARIALSVRSGRNPSETAAYELLPLYPVILGGQCRMVAAKLIKNTLDTLAKYGI